MKFNVKVEVTKEVDIKYLCVDVIPRYWYECEFNGETDISWEQQQNGEMPRIPLAVECDNWAFKDDRYKLFFKIDIESGKVVGWPEGNTAVMHYEIGPDGTYWLEDVDGNEIHKIRGYWPKILEVNDEHFAYDGMHISLSIREDGSIENWHNEGFLKILIELFLSRGTSIN